MKARRFFFCLFLILAGGAAEVRALQEPARNYAREMAVNADVQADFYRRYPDLQNEQDLVSAAARALAVEGVQSRNDAAAAELLARRTRALQARRTPAEWQSKAVSLFPELGVAGSEFNLLFLRHVKELQRTSPQFMQEPSWPVLLAQRCADELRPKAPAVAGDGALTSDQGLSTPAKPAGRTPWWASLLSVLVLLAIIVQPARLLWRCRRAFAGSGAPLTLWQAALGPAMWTYLAVALFALARTFMANADQQIVGRFGITLLVSLLSGVVFALPAYVLGLGGMWWWRQRTPPSPQIPERPVAETAAVPAAGRKF
jgi:hypothetical protein